MEYEYDDKRYTEQKNFFTTLFNMLWLRVEGTESEDALANAMEDFMEEKFALANNMYY